MGRAEAGKTTLCSQFIANGYTARYEHTEDPHMYYREMKPRDLTLNGNEHQSNATNTGNSKHKHHHGGKKSKKMKKAVTRYGVQLEDVPGEINEEVAEDSAEHEIIQRGHPQDYYDLMVAEEEVIDESEEIGADEKSALLGKEKEKLQKEKNIQKEKYRRAQKNRLYAPSRSHGFIIVYDVESKPSFKKALAIHKAIRQNEDKKRLPIYILGNKIDISKSSAIEQIEKMTEHARNSPDTDAATGSLSRNEIYFQDRIMTSADFVNCIVQNLNKSGLFMADTGNDRRDKRNRKKQGYNANDDEGGSTGCFGCCATTATEETNDDGGP